MLTQIAALRKDRTTGNSVQMQHRHFAFIARTISNLNIPTKELPFIIDGFADALAETNPNFDRKRFNEACLAKGR